MLQGYIKLWRKTMMSNMYQSLNAIQRDVMFTCLMLANHAPRKWEWQGQIFTCQPGQFVTSLESLKNKCARGVSIKMVRTALLKLEKWDFLANQGTKTGRLITIINWDTYQNKHGEEGKETGKEGAKKGQSKGKEGATNNNVKNDKNVKNKDIPPWIPEKEWQDFLEMRKANNKAVKTEATFEALIKKLSKLKDQGEDIRAVLEQSVERSYQGLFPIKDKGVGKGKTPSIKYGGE